MSHQGQSGKITINIRGQQAGRTSTILDIICHMPWRYTYWYDDIQNIIHHILYIYTRIKLGRSRGTDYDIYNIYIYICVCAYIYIYHIHSDTRSPCSQIHKRKPSHHDFGRPKGPTAFEFHATGQVYYQVLICNEQRDCIWGLRVYTLRFPPYCICGA